MEPHPARAVEVFAKRNCEGLREVHRALAIAVPEAFSIFERRHPDGRVQGGVFAAAVRDVVLVEFEANNMRLHTLLAIEGAFRSVRLVDPSNLTCRVHVHPRDWMSKRYIPITQHEVETLWGADMALAPFELAVLWIPSVRTKALRDARLAAVANIEERTKTLVYAASPLPPIGPESPTWEPKVTDTYTPVVDDLSDFFADLDEFSTRAETA